MWTLTLVIVFVQPSVVCRSKMEQTMIIRTKEASEHKSTVSVVVKLLCEWAHLDTRILCTFFPGISWFLYTDAEMILTIGRQRFATSGRKNGHCYFRWRTYFTLSSRNISTLELNAKFWFIWCTTWRKLRPITSEDGRMIKAWFDQPKGELDENEDEEGIKQASAFIMKVVDEEMQLSKIPSHQIFLGGFGQGGALALYTTLTSKIRFAGVICLSGWLPLRSKFPAMMTEVNKEVPMHLSHGETDRMVPFSLGQSTYAFLRQIGCSSVYFKRYPNVGHHKTLTQLKDFQRFINTFCPVHQPRSQS